MSEPLVLTLSCADRPGITARVTSFLFERGGNILEAQQFNDRSSDAFFMRVEFDPGEASREMIRTEFAPIAAEHGMGVAYHNPREGVRVAIGLGHNPFEGQSFGLERYGTLSHGFNPPMF